MLRQDCLYTPPYGSQSPAMPSLPDRFLPPLDRTAPHNSRKRSTRDDEEGGHDANDHGSQAFVSAHGRPRRLAEEEARGERCLQRGDVPRPAVEDGAVATDDVARDGGELLIVGGEADGSVAGEAVVDVFGDDCEEKGDGDLGLGGLEREGRKTEGDGRGGRWKEVGGNEVGEEVTRLTAAPKTAVRTVCTITSLS